MLLPSFVPMEFRSEFPVKQPPIRSSCSHVTPAAAALLSKHVSIKTFCIEPQDLNSTAAKPERSARPPPEVKGRHPGCLHRGY